MNKESMKQGAKFALRMVAIALAGLLLALWAAWMDK